MPMNMEGEPLPIRIIDMHCHLEPTESISKSNLEFYHHCRTSPEKGVDDLLWRMDKAEVEKAVLIDDNKLVRKLIRERSERFLGFAPIDPREGAGKIDELTKAGFRGIKLLPAWQRFYPNELMMAKIYQKACDLNIPVVFTSVTLTERLYGIMIPYYLMRLDTTTQI